MASRWRWFLKLFHPQGIPWPGTILYNRVSRTDIFQRHYDLVADDVARYCPRGRVLDVGTGPGWLLLAMRERLSDVRLAGVDISPAMVSQARRNIEETRCSDTIEVIAASAAALPFPDGSFDAVVSTGSIHHWKDPKAALNEAHRVLAPGGCALIYDLVRKPPEAVARETARRFGKARLALLWLRSFEEPFYGVDEMQALASATRFGEGETRFVGALCCLVLTKE